MLISRAYLLKIHDAIQSQAAFAQEFKRRSHGWIAAPGLLCQRIISRRRGPA